MVKEWRIVVCKFAADMLTAQVFLKLLQLRPSCWIDEHAFITNNIFTKKAFITAFLTTADMAVTGDDIKRDVKALMEHNDMGWSGCSLHVVESKGMGSYDAWKSIAHFDEVHAEDGSVVTTE